MSIDKSSFCSFSDRFRELSQKENPQISEVLPLIQGCVDAVAEAKKEPSERVSEAARSVFVSLDALFTKLLPTLSVVDKKIIASFMTTVVTMVPNLRTDTLSGLEGTIVRVCAAVMPLFEEDPPPAEDEEGASDDAVMLSEFLRPLAASMEKMDLCQAPFLQVLDLFKRTTALFVHNLLECEESVFTATNLRLGTVAKKLSEMGGMTPRLFAHWKTLVEELMEDPAPGDFIEHLLCSIAIWISCVAQAKNFSFTVEAEASFRAIFDSLDQMVIRALQGEMTPEEKKALLSLRSKTLLGASLLHPVAVLERYNRQEELLIELKPEEVLLKACAGLGHAVHDRTSQEQLVAYVSSIAARIVQESNYIPRSEIERIVSLLGKAIVSWRSRETFFSQLWMTVLREIEKIRTAPIPTFDGFQNLYAFFFGIAFFLKLHKEFLDAETAKGFFTAVDTFVDVIQQIPAMDDRFRAMIVEAQRLLAERLQEIWTLQPSGFLPTFALDWYDKAPDDPVSPSVETALSAFPALQEVKPEKVPLSMASEALSRALLFALCHSSDMADEEWYSSVNYFLRAHKAWAFSEKLGVKVIDAWVKGLRFVRSEYLSVAESELLENPRGSSRGERKKLESFQTWRRVFIRLDDLLVSSLSTFEDGKKGLLPEIFAAIAPMVQEVCELLSRSEVKFVRSSADPYRATERLFFILGRVAPAPLIEWISAANPGALPSDFIRKTEKLLVSCHRCTDISDLQLRLMFLEHASAELERYCYREGVRLMPHPVIPGPSLRPASGAGEESLLHSLMEESMVLNDLDASCALNCQEYASNPAKRRWALFTLRFYLRSYVEKVRRAYSTLYRHTESALKKKIQKTADDRGVLGPGSLIPRDRSSLPLMLKYDEFCSGSLFQLNDPEAFLGEAVAHFQQLFRDAVGYANKIRGEFSALWPVYERGVRVANGHIEKIAGYGRIDELPEEPIFPPMLAYEDRPAIADSLFQSWLLCLLKGGEEGLARAIAESLAQKNPKLKDKILQEFGVIGESEPAVPARTSSCPSSPSSWLPPMPKMAIVKGAKPQQSKRKKSPRPPSRLQEVHEASSLPATPEEGSILKIETDLKEAVQGLTLDESPKEDLPPPNEEEALEFIDQPRSQEESPLPDEEETFKSSDQPRPQEVLVPGLSLNGPHRDDLCTAPWIRPVTVAEIERLMQRPVGTIDERVFDRWKFDFFSSPSQDEYDRHTYPYQLIPLIQTFGEEEGWLSKRGTIDPQFVCIGTMERYGRGLPTIFGVFSEGFSKRKLYHHDILKRSKQVLAERLSKKMSCFDMDARRVPREVTPFQEALLKTFCESGSFFSPLQTIPFVECCNGRFRVRIGRLTLQVDDLKFKNSYTLALKVVPA